MGTRPWVSLEYHPKAGPTLGIRQTMSILVFPAARWRLCFNFFLGRVPLQTQPTKKDALSCSHGHWASESQN